MGRFNQSNADDSADMSIDISPLIDCVFILLIFFIVTTTFVEEPGVDVTRTRVATAERLEKSSILIAVTAKGNVVYGGRDIGVAGVQALIKRMLQKEDLPVIIQADNESQVGIVDRVVGEAKLAGATRVSLATRAGSG